MKYYMYIFVAEGLTPEQVAVQAAHATFVAGCNEAPRSRMSQAPYSPETVHFVLCKMNDTTLDWLDFIDLPFTSFYEDNYIEGRDVLTAIATMPIPEDDDRRKKLQNYQTLRFKQKVETSY